MNRPAQPSAESARKIERIAEVVVDAAIDHVDALEAVGGAHVDDVVVGDQVAAFDQIDAHLAREIGVLKVGGVEDARREQHDVRLGAAFRRERAQRGQQQLRIVLDGPHAVAVKELRKGALHHAAVGEHVADARGHAQVVLEHDKLAGVEAQQVGADDGDVDVARHLQSAHLPPVVLAAIDQLARDDAVVEDFGVGVDIAQKEIERGDALREAALDAVPLLRRDEARQQVVGEDALGALVAAVDGEGDALGEEREVGRLLAALQLIGGQAGQGFGKGAVVRAHFAAGLAHLVEGLVERVVSEKRFQLHWMACAHVQVEIPPSSGFRALAEWIAQREATGNCWRQFLGKLRLSPALLVLTRGR